MKAAYRITAAAALAVAVSACSAQNAGVNPTPSLAQQPPAGPNVRDPITGHTKHVFFSREYLRRHPGALRHPMRPDVNSANNLIYGGGPVETVPKIYLVFWGTQWGTQGTDSAGNLTFSNDPAQGAPYLQKLFKGLGTGNELWSGTMTQYCDGSSVAAGATTCPSGAPHIGYPTGGALAGVYYGMQHAGRAYAYLGGFDPAFEEASPGAILIGHAIAEAIGEGAGEFHFLRGREAYKYSWGAADRWNQRRLWTRRAHAQ